MKLVNLTFPHIRHFHDYSISTVFRYRPVHSDFSSADVTLHTRHRYFIDSRPITPSHLWLGFALPIGAVAGAYSRLQRAVSVSENAFRFFQRSIRGSVSRRYPIIPLLVVSVREFSSPSFYLFAGEPTQSLYATTCRCTIKGREAPHFFEVLSSIF